MTPWVSSGPKRYCVPTSTWRPPKSSNGLCCAGTIFQEVRAHLGVETQRQWSDRAIARTTPVLFGLFSWVTLAAHLLAGNQGFPLRSAAWYAKRLPTFSDAIALVSGIGPLVFGIDETIERRRGKRISAKGIYRDGVRSSQGHFVKASGLRWVSLMWLAPIPWAGRVWALPFLTVLAPSERFHRERGQRHKKLTDWARQMILQLRRWLPRRPLVLVADSSYAVLDLLHFCQFMASPVTFITRLRLDAALYEPVPPRSPGQLGPPRLKGKRLPTLKDLLGHPTTLWNTVTVDWYDNTHRLLEIASHSAVWYHQGKSPVPIRWVLIRDPLGEFRPQALLCTDLNVAPTQIIQWFVLRWQLEVTFQEVLAHLGVETQRQWSDRAIARTTPVLFALFSWVTLAAHLLAGNQGFPLRSAAWYAKRLPTFSDAIALVRHQLWPVSLDFTAFTSTLLVKVSR